VSEHDEYVISDAALRMAARQIRSLLPRWFVDLCDDHSAEVLRVRVAGDRETAAVLEAHGPMLDDFGEGWGVVCRDAHTDAEGFEDPQVYPCSLLAELRRQTTVEEAS